MIVQRKQEEVSELKTELESQSENNSNTENSDVEENKISSKFFFYISKPQ
jgi:hypothetical protein